MNNGLEKCVKVIKWFASSIVINFLSNKSFTYLLPLGYPEKRLVKNAKLVSFGKLKIIGIYFPKELLNKSIKPYSSSKSDIIKNGKRLGNNVSFHNDIENVIVRATSFEYINIKIKKNNNINKIILDSSLFFIINLLSDIINKVMI